MWAWFDWLIRQQTSSRLSHLDLNVSDSPEIHDKSSNKNRTGINNQNTELLNEKRGFSGPQTCFHPFNQEIKDQSLCLNFSVNHQSLFKRCSSHGGLFYLGMKFVWPPIASVADACPAVLYLLHTAMYNTGSGGRLCCSWRLFIAHKRLCLKPGIPPRVLHYHPRPVFPQRTTC